MTLAVAQIEEPQVNSLLLAGEVSVIARGRWVTVKLLVTEFVVPPAAS